LERFEQEAKAVAKLSHPNILEIFDYGHEGDIAFSVTELLQGQSLRERLDEGSMPVRKAVEFVVQVTAGLAAAHERGVVHRDLKPENLYITTEGRAKILDFGLALVEIERPDSDSGGVTESLTAPGAVMGTFGYMSPEQVRGEAVDERSDIFSLGAVFYEMLTGSRAFDGSSIGEVLGAILRDEPTPLRVCDESMPESVERIIQHCLEKRREERFQSASDLGFALTNTLTRSQVGEDRPSAGPWRVPQRVSRFLWGTAVGSLITLSLIALLYERPRPNHTPVRLSTFTYSGRDWAPSASPDGEMVAFASDRDGVSRIWLKHVVGGGEAPLTDGPDDLPRFSPDGSQVLFVRDRDGVMDLWRSSVVGGQEHKVLSDVLEADWSQDGSQVVFLRMALTGSDNLLRVGVAGVQSGEQRILVEIENRSCYGVRWSPDGRSILVSETGLHGMVAELSHVVLIDVESGVLERFELTDWPGPYSAGEWTPRGLDLVIGQAAHALARVSDLPSQVMVHNLETARSRCLFWAPLRMPYTGWTFSTIAVLDAHRLVVDGQLVQARLVETSWPGDEGAAPPRVLTKGLGRDRQPAFSPDGSKIVFSSNRSGNIDLWALDRASGKLHQLTDDSADDWDPAFTPDGESLLWSSSRSGNMEIWMAAADGSRARQVTRDGVDAENPTMTADGRWIVHASANDAKLGVWKIHPDGSNATRIVAGSAVLPEVSPDGRFALYLRLRGGGYVMRFVEVESGEPVGFEIELPTRDRGVNAVIGRARWTPDGDAVVFVAHDLRGNYGLFLQDFVLGQDTLGSRRRLAGFSHDLNAESFGISPDGSSIVISAMAEERSLRLAEGISLVGWN
jgi:Tol biopolymer transport system component